MPESIEDPLKGLMELLGTDHHIGIDVLETKVGSIKGAGIGSLIGDIANRSPVGLLVPVLGQKVFIKDREKGSRTKEVTNSRSFPLEI
jgi:hypothetical protein